MNIYFSGIGGVGIGPLAMIARDAGNSISGSDISESLTTHELIQSGVAISFDQSGKHLIDQHMAQPIDWFVYTAALTDDHPELLAARDLGIKTAKRDELLAHIISEHNLKLIAVAGTHGKTTTTGMLIWTLQELGVEVSYSLGSTINFGPSGKFAPDSEYFVYECDEFDKNFLHFNPYLSLITSVDYDHPDTYPTEEEYKSAFRQFVHQSQRAILWQHDANYMKTRDPSTWCLQPDEELNLELAGAHNRRNGTLVLKALEYLHIGENLSNRHELEAFPGTNRRFEKLAENLYSDYGHHPVEIAATLQMASELSDNIVLVYQPHQNTRQHELIGEYTNQFERASRTYWLPTYLSREDTNLPIVSFNELTGTITNRDTIIEADHNEDLWQKITQARKDGALVLCMGAGSIDNWVRQNL
jgi:UDP-N-acetylmuramate--alanine ligase